MKLVSEWRGLEEVTLIAVKQYQFTELLDVLYAKVGRTNHSLFTKWNGSYKMAGLFARGFLCGNCGAWGNEDKRELGSPYGIGSTKIASIGNHSQDFLN